MLSLIVCLVILLPACSLIRETARVVIIPPIAIAAGILDLVAPGGEGPAIRDTPATLDIYGANGQRVGYAKQRSDGTVDVFRADSTRRATISPAIGGGYRVTLPGARR